MFPRVCLITSFMTIIFCLCSCSSPKVVSSQIISKQKSISSSHSSGFSLKDASNNIVAITTLQELQKKSQALDSSPGRVSLALILNKLDNALVIEDLAKKSPQELFDTLRKTAPQKSQTLQGLDQLYGLKNILASDGINVDFQANNVISAVSTNNNLAWTEKFLKAINNSNGE
jgi:hypothetical protein